MPDSDFKYPPPQPERLIDPTPVTLKSANGITNQHDLNNVDGFAQRGDCVAKLALELLARVERLEALATDA